MLEGSRAAAILGGMSLAELREAHGGLLEVAQELISPAAITLVLALAEDIQLEILSRALNNKDAAAKVWRHTQEN